MEVWWLVEISPVVGVDYRTIITHKIMHGLLDYSFEFQDYVS